MSRAAVTQANKASATAFNPTPQPGDPSYGAFRKHWMDAYIQAGGEYQQLNGEQQREKIQEARKEAEKHTGLRGAVTPCADGGGNGALQDDAIKPVAAPASQPPKDCDCRLTALEVKCSHGRTAKDRRLMVVSDHVQGDMISVSPTATGSCETKLVVRADSKDGYPVTGPRSSSFRASELPLDIGPLGQPFSIMLLKNAKPLTTLVTAEADGGTELVSVEAYPSKKMSVKVDIKGLLEKYEGILAYLPIDTGAKRQPIRPLDAAYKENGYKTGASFSGEAQWAEVESGAEKHLAYCEMSLNGGAELGVGGSYPVPYLAIPPTIPRIRAGVYFNIDLMGSASGASAWAYWPCPGEVRWKGVKLELAGTLTIELAAELLLLSPDAIQVKAAARTTGTVKGWAEKENGEQLALQFAAEWKPLNASVVVKLAWELFEYEENWQLLTPYKTPPMKWVPFK